LIIDGRICSVALSDRLFLEASAVEAQVTAIEPDIATIVADVATVIAVFYPVITNASGIMIESTLGLGGSSSKDQTGCEYYSKFSFHNIHFY
jgi:hypothetical protein